MLLYLQTEAIRTSNPEVELGRSMHAWLSRMGIPAGGKNYKLGHVDGIPDMPF